MTDLDANKMAPQAWLAIVVKGMAKNVLQENVARLRVLYDCEPNQARRFELASQIEIVRDELGMRR